MNISTVCRGLTGVGTYALNLARNLPFVAPDNEWLYFGASRAFAQALPGGRLILGGRSGLGRALWQQTILPVVARRTQIDLLHGADFSSPVLYRGATVNTVHGISAFSDENFYPLAKRLYSRAFITTALRRSSAIITVSEFTRSQILERFAIDDGRVFAIHHGVAPVHGACEPNIDSPFLLFVGTLESRKNLVPLVSAFQILSLKHRIPHRLVLAGGLGHGWEDIRAAIGASGVSEAIDVRGYVSAEELAQLYRSATLVAFPAFWEDFGLPVIEAMSYGTPVVCARAAALPEVGGDAAEYFDPSDAGDIAAAILRVLGSRDRWLDLHARGLERAALFTWEECARKHVAVYRSVLSS